VFGLDCSGTSINAFLWQYDTTGNLKGTGNINITTISGLSGTNIWYPYITIYTNNVANTTYKFLTTFTINNWTNILAN
jgi:hypothetical protein